MLIKKRDLEIRYTMFSQLEVYNGKVGKDPEDKTVGSKKVIPYEVLRNLAHIQPVFSRLLEEDRSIALSLRDSDKMYIIGTDEETEDTEGVSILPESKMPEYRKLREELMNEEIDLPIFLISSDKLEELVEESHINHDVVALLASLGYIKD